MMGAAFPPRSPRSIEDLLKARLDRQKILRRDRPPLALFVVDEGALRRTAGGKSVMREQYKALIEAAEWPFVQIQVLPFDRGAHAAMEGSLVLLTMTHAESLVYAETPGSGQVMVVSYRRSNITGHRGCSCQNDGCSPSLNARRSRSPTREEKAYEPSPGWSAGTSR
nr:DUF5753 domain-containing protein [Nocardiopsis sp. CNT312]